MKDLTRDSIADLLDVMKDRAIAQTEVMDILEQLTYIARDNGYDDDMLCQIIDLLEEGN
jgi:hypothetical protein